MGAQVAAQALTTVLVLVLVFGVYFLPSFVGRHKRNSGAIVVLNLFLGWTLVGWVAALVWALTVEPDSRAIPQVPQPMPAAQIQQAVLQPPTTEKAGSSGFALFAVCTILFVGGVAILLAILHS